jgi:hypothetical protein
VTIPGGVDHGGGSKLDSTADRWLVIPLLAGVLAVAALLGLLIWGRKILGNPS